ncbi:MAG: hypothetical protein RIQ79_2540 [Verrucomicrobiota bacterium]
MRLLRSLQPALAALLAACVLLLGLAAYSPDLHEIICAEQASFHHRHTGHADADGPHGPAADHDCAVFLFAHGCTDTVPAIWISPTVLNATAVAHFTEFMLARTLRGPARVCGPPVPA